MPPDPEELDDIDDPLDLLPEDPPLLDEPLELDPESDE